MEVLTVSEAQHPQPGDGQLGKVILLPRSVVGRVAHLLLGVQPLVGHNGDQHHQEGEGCGERGQHPETGECGLQGSHLVGVVVGGRGRVRRGGRTAGERPLHLITPRGAAGTGGAERVEKGRRRVWLSGASWSGLLALEKYFF